MAPGPAGGLPIDIAGPVEAEVFVVYEHALRHLAWLAKEDEAVKATLSPRWHASLSAYVPEPFRQLDGEEA